MKRTALIALLILGAGCASQPAVATKSAASLSRNAQGQPRQDAALRHFYLLSPGPNATLVVTRSDLSDR